MRENLPHYSTRYPLNRCEDQYARKRAFSGAWDSSPGGTTRYFIPCSGAHPCPISDENQFLIFHELFSELACKIHTRFQTCICFISDCIRYVLSIREIYYITFFSNRQTAETDYVCPPCLPYICLLQFSCSQ